MTETIVQIIVIAILVLMSAFFSASETALTSCSPTKVRTMVDSGIKGAATLDKVLKKKAKMLSAILIGNNIVNLTASTLTTIVVQSILGSWAAGIGTGIITLLVLVFGEVSPKTLATVRAERIALKVSGIIYALMIIMTPLSAVINFLARGVLRLLGVKKGEKRKGITESELRTIVQVSHEEGILESEEKDYINNIFDFSDKRVHEIMVPRINVTSISADATYDELIEAFKEKFFTRLPVLDENGSIMGVVNVKDLVVAEPRDLKNFKAAQVMRKMEFTFEQKKLGELFTEMRAKHCSMMGVLDEYGDTVGIVTLEDLLEELVGDIRDEYDANEEQEIVRNPDGTYSIMGHVDLDDINDELGTDLSSDEYESLGGLMIGILDRVPEEGETVTTGGLELTAEKVDGARIEKVRLRMKDPNEEDEENE